MVLAVLLQSAGALIPGTCLLTNKPVGLLPFLYIFPVCTLDEVAHATMLSQTPRERGLLENKEVILALSM